MGLAYLLLGAAIVVEVAATAALPRAQGFTDPVWSAFVLGGYAVSIWLLAIVVREMPVSVAYAVWSGAGTALVAIVGLTLLGESVGPAKAFFLAMIIAGVVGLNLVAGH
ncbi:DMT family transporter [Nocardioides donggukensis]|uniref:Multidrug efflux SMR transporter n=1 Tax=Nocardioides donggukensis TaxID=2774019 RepID=A0A927K464_9ACTN|nr:multidrug efflux SMR transporter [Nocardioides donggukensis]MBD8868523.1 multidrug efflux SMR transporter [Nocardioides donggukensis]